MRKVVLFACAENKKRSLKSLFPKEKFFEWHVIDPQTLEQFRTVRDELVVKINQFIPEHNL